MCEGGCGQILWCKIPCVTTRLPDLCMITTTVFFGIIIIALIVLLVTKCQSGTS